MVKEEVIDLTKLVKIKATSKAKHMVAGQIYEVHPVQAELLKKKGWAEDYKDEEPKKEEDPK